MRRCVFRCTLAEKDVFQTVLSKEGFCRLAEVIVLFMAELFNPQIPINLLVLSILKLDLIEYLFVLLQMLSQHILQNGLLILDFII